MSVVIDRCPYLNDRVVKGDAINAECGCDDKEKCPKIRTMKKVINMHCWKIKIRS